MMIRKYILLFCFLLPLAACKEKTSQQNTSEAPETVQSLVIQTEGGKSHDFTVELALTPEVQKKGLMNRPKLDKDSGMLFYFETEQDKNFWMKDTLIPLDMLFIKGDGTIHHIFKNAIPNDETPISSQGKVNAVLEINGGVSDKLGIKVGDKVKHPLFK